MTTYIRTQSVPDMILQMTWQRVAMNTMALIILLITTITKKLSVCSTIRATKTLTNYNRNDSSQNRRREGKDAARVFSLNCWFTSSFPWTITTQCLCYLPELWRHFLVHHHQLERMLNHHLSQLWIQQLLFLLAY